MTLFWDAKKRACNCCDRYAYTVRGKCPHCFIHCGESGCSLEKENLSDECIGNFKITRDPHGDLRVEAVGK